MTIRQLKGLSYGHETEELRLRVIMDDQASGAITALRNNIQQLTSGATAAQLESHKRRMGEPRRADEKS
jgi:hypothetical protein